MGSRIPLLQLSVPTLPRPQLVTTLLNLLRGGSTCPLSSTTTLCTFPAFHSRVLLPRSHKLQGPILLKRRFHVFVNTSEMSQAFISSYTLTRRGNNSGFTSLHSPILAYQIVRLRSSKHVQANTTYRSIGQGQSPTTTSTSFLVYRRPQSG